MKDLEKTRFYEVLTGHPDKPSSSSSDVVHQIVKCKCLFTVWRPCGEYMKGYLWSKGELHGAPAVCKCK